MVQVGSETNCTTFVFNSLSELNTNVVQLRVIMYSRRTKLNRQSQIWEDLTISNRVKIRKKTYYQLLVLLLRMNVIATLQSIDFYNLLIETET